MRKSWDEYFLGVLHAVQERSTCDRGKAAAIIVKDHRILATGYAGSPAGVEHCDDVGHQFIESYEKSGDKLELRKHCIRTIHAEQNAISQAAKFGIPLGGSEIYVTMFPCYTCSKLLINCGIIKVIAEHDYLSSEMSKALFDQINLPYALVNDSIKSYQK